MVLHLDIVGFKEMINESVTKISLSLERKVLKLVNVFPHLK